MPVLHKYRDVDAFYLKTYLNGVYSTFQLTREAYAWLRRNELLVDECDIGFQSFLELHGKGWLFTGGGGHIITTPPAPELSVAHQWQLKPDGLSLYIRHIATKHLDYEGPAVLKVDDNEYVGEVRQNHFLGLPQKGIARHGIMPFTDSGIIRLEDDEGGYLADTELGLFHRGAMLFKSDQPCKESIVEVDPAELDCTFPLGVCLVLKEDSIVSITGGTLEQYASGWRGVAVYSLKTEHSQTSQIAVIAENSRWTLHIRALMGLQCPGEPSLVCDEVLFTGENGVFPILPDDPMNLEIMPWQEEQGNPFIQADTQLRIETATEYHSWDALDLMPYLMALDSKTRRFSLQQFIEDKHLVFSDRFVTVRLQGPGCREDIRITFYPIPGRLELPPCRIGEYACLKMGDSETIIQSDNPVLLEDGLRYAQVSGTIHVDEAGTLTATWMPLVEDALLLVEEGSIPSGSTVSSADLKSNIDFVLLASSDRNWNVYVGDMHSSLCGPARFSLNQLLSEHVGDDSDRKLPLDVLLEERSIAKWTLDLTPTIVTLQCCWTQAKASISCCLNMQGTWFGFRGLAPKLVLYVDGHRIQEFSLGDDQERVGPVEHRVDVRFPIADAQIGFYRDAGRIHLEAVFAEHVLEQVSVESCPFSPPESDPEQLRQAIRAILQQAHEPETNEDACYEQALYLTEQYLVQTGRMPFAADALCSQLGLSPTAEMVKAGLHLMEALMSQQVLMVALPTTCGTSGRCELVVMTLRVFYEVFLFSRGLGMPARLVGRIAELTGLGATIENRRLRSWAVAVAAYGNTTLAGKDALPTEAERKSLAEAAQDPMIRFHVPFNVWLEQ